MSVDAGFPAGCVGQQPQQRLVVPTALGVLVGLELDAARVFAEAFRSSTGLVHFVQEVQ